LQVELASLRVAEAASSGAAGLEAARNA
jgi:hypothetical protein